jgi:hypothetical protein
VTYLFFHPPSAGHLFHLRHGRLFLHKRILASSRRQSQFLGILGHPPLPFKEDQKTISLEKFVSGRLAGGSKVHLFLKNI